MKHTTTVLAAMTALLGLAVSAPKPVYAKTVTKKVTRTIKVYKPGKYSKVKQTVTLKKKKGHKWTTSKWKTYKAPTVSGYTASPKTVKAAKVTHKTKNKTVKITYKAIKRAAVKKTAYKTVKKAKPAAVKKTVKHTTVKKDGQYQMRKDVLGVINSFRAKVGVKPIKMSSKYNAILDKRAVQKAKLYSTTDTLNHSGYFNLPSYLNTYPVVNGKAIEHGGETLHAYGYGNESEMKSLLVPTFTENIQAEKVDYEAIFIKKTRKNITNPAGTIGHYKMMIDSGNHTAYIGFGHYGSGDKARACIVIEFHA